MSLVVVLVVVGTYTFIKNYELCMAVKPLIVPSYWCTFLKGLQCMQYAYFILTLQHTHFIEILENHRDSMFVSEYVKPGRDNPLDT